MIKHNERKISAKKKASLLWQHHIESTCAWSEWIDEEDFDSMSENELNLVMEHMEKLMRRMTKILKKSRGEK